MKLTTTLNFFATICCVSCSVTPLRGLFASSRIVSTVVLLAMLFAAFAPETRSATISDAERAELVAGLATLKVEVAKAERAVAGNEKLAALLPDVQVCVKALDWAVNFDKRWSQRRSRPSEMTDADIVGSNLALWGDPQSNPNPLNPQQNSAGQPLRHCAQPAQPRRQIVCHLYRTAQGPRDCLSTSSAPQHQGIACYSVASSAYLCLPCPPS